MPKKIVMRGGRIYVDEWTPGVDPTGMFCPKCRHKQEIDYYELLEHGVTCEECGHLATKEDEELRIYPFRATARDQYRRAVALKPALADIFPQHALMFGSEHIMSTTYKIGDKIQNRWEVHDILEGGMGIIYIVYDHNWHEVFAAKTFRDKVFSVNPKIAQLFTQEVYTWVNLDAHQNITEARFIENIGDRPFLFLEYISGGDLSKYIGTPRLMEDLPQLLEFAIQFCDGMIYALSKGIKAHRDIKPQNCLITEDLTLKVSDFGLAKIFDNVDLSQTEKSTSNKIHLNSVSTQTGMVAGTPEYMAPEQFDDIKHLDVRADIYSFGVMLFQMITGKLPFTGTKQELKHLHKTQSPPPPNSKLKTLNNIVCTCLEKKPNNRFFEFNEVREELAKIYTNLTDRTAPKPIFGKELDAARWNNKGWSLNNLGRYEEALSCYEHALAINPNMEQAWNNKGIALGELRRIEKEFYCYEQAIKINPDYAEPWSNKGLILNDAGQQDEALSCYDKAIKSDPFYEKAWYNKAIT